MSNFVPYVILNKFDKGERYGRFSATTLFIDFAGFSALTESMFRDGQTGAEQLSQAIEANFAPVINAVQEAGGIIPLFAGDSFIAIFPSAPHSTDDEQNAWAIISGIITQWTSNQTESKDSPTMGIKIGMAKGEVEWGIVGENGRFSYYFRGNAIDQCANAQSHAKSGQVVVSSTLISSPSSPTLTPINHTDYYQVSQWPAVELKPTLPTVIPNKQTLNLIRLFVPQSVQSFQGQAEFRTIAPVFISFRHLETHRDLNSFVSLVIQLTDKFGGTFSQLDFGDKGGVIVLWFGAPVSYENNVQRAISCLMTLQLNHKFKNRWRAGVSHGLVWAGIRGASSRNEYGAIGNVVNTAARLAFKSNWGTLWVDENVAVKIKDTQNLKGLGKIALKGLSNQTAVYQLTHQFKEPITSPIGTFIGRESELSYLNEAIAPLFEGQFGGVIYLDGEAGIGKSQLIVEWLSRNKSRLNWLNCSANDILKQSLSPIRNGLSQYFSIAPYITIDDIKARLKAKLENLQHSLNQQEPCSTNHPFGKISQIEKQFQKLFEVDGVHTLHPQADPKLKYQNLLNSITTFIKALSCVQPLILLIEDAHWLDRDTKSYLDSLPNLLGNYPVALVIVCRNLEGRSQFALNIPQYIPTSRLSLKQLSSSHSENLIKSVAKRKLMPDSLNYLQSKSNGNPLFLKQLTIMFNEKAKQPKVKSFKTVQMAEYQMTPLLPETINDLLVSRLDQLEPETKQLVQLAAVLGQKSSSKVLRALSDSYQIDFDRCRETAVHQNIWQDSGKSECRFVHALMRDAAYMMQMQSQKRTLHIQAAQAFENLYADNIAPHLEEISHHYETAFHLGEATVLNHAITYLNQAANEAANNYENWAVIDHLKRALAITPAQNKDEIFHLQANLIKTFAILGDRSEEASYLSQIEPLFHELSQAQQIELLFLQSEYFISISDYKKLIPLAQKGIQIAKIEKNLLAEARFYMNMGLAHQRRLQFDLAKERYLQAKKIALFLEEGDFIADSYWGMGSLYFEYGHFSTAEKYFKQALNIHNSSQNTPEIARILNALAASKAEQGNLIEAKSIFLKCQQIAEEIGNQYFNGVLHGNLGKLSEDLKEFDEAEQLYLNSITLYQEVGNLHGASITYNNLGGLFERFGFYDKALDFFNKGLVLAQKISFTREEIKLLGQISQVELLHGNFEKSKLLLLKNYDLAINSDNPRLKAGSTTRLGFYFFDCKEYQKAIVKLEQALVYWLENEEKENDHMMEVLVYLAKACINLGWVDKSEGYVNIILAKYDLNSLYECAYQPFIIHLMLYQVLSELNDNFAVTVLDGGYSLLIKYSEKIKSSEYRASFLNNIATHKTIISTWEATFLDKQTQSVNNSPCGKA